MRDKEKRAPEWRLVPHSTARPGQSVLRWAVRHGALALGLALALALALTLALTLALILTRWTAELGLDQMCKDSWNWIGNNPDGFDTKA